MEEFNHLGEHEAIRAMAKHTDRLVEIFRELAVSHNVNIISGSMPKEDENGHLKNVAFLCEMATSTAMRRSISRRQKPPHGVCKVGINFKYSIPIPERLEY